MEPATIMTGTGRADRPGGFQGLMAEMLARVAAARDATAFAALFDYYGPRVKALMVRSGASADVAEDLVQETMLIVWRKAGLYAPERGLVSTWIFRIARNLRVDRLRRRGPQYYADMDEVCEEGAPAEAETEVERAEEKRAVEEALTRLPPDQREIIELSFLRGLTQTEIAQRLSLPLGTVKSRMRLAYAKLRSALEVLR